MPESEVPTPLSEYLGKVVRRALTSFAWTRDMLIGTALAIGTIVLQARLGLISSQDWHEHWRLWIASFAIPYGLVVVPHLLWRLAEAPWRVHQDLEQKHQGWQQIASEQLQELQNKNATLQDRITNQTWPDKRPQLTIDRWGNKEAGGISRPEMGFYLTNHGEAALEVKMENFTLGAYKCISNTIASIEAKQKELLIVEREDCSTGKRETWLLSETLRAAGRSQFLVEIRYRDFNNNWYRSTAMLKVLTHFGGLEIGPTTQEKLGSS
jgi:hypothetical protein